MAAQIVDVVFYDGVSFTDRQPRSAPIDAQSVLDPLW